MHHIRRAALPLALAGALVVSASLAAGAATTNPSPGALELTNAALSERAATQGMVLLENHDSALPMQKSGNVALFGVGAYKTVKGGTGSGRVNNRSTVSVRQGLEGAGYRVTTSDSYYDTMVDAFVNAYGDGGDDSLKAPKIDYSSVEQALDSSTVAPTSPTETAIYVLARNSGEASDRSSGKGDYELADVERANIELIGRTYKHVIVVLNVGGVVDTAFYHELNSSEVDPDGGTAIDSLLLMSQAGQESGNALVKVLNGQVTPSGKLTDTWADKYSYYPASTTFGNNDGNSSTEKYTEGIYVGYRYFDSFYRTIDAANPGDAVNYPFGYGLSYTDFHIDPQKVAADVDHVTVKAKVTNVGLEYTGKEVVEVYASAPQDGLDEPYQQLVGYAKTSELAPGGAQTLTVRFDTSSLASYDSAKAANVLAAGDYAIRIGNSSRNTHVVAKLRVGSATTVEQLANELDGADPSTDRVSDPANFYSYPGEAAELAAAPTIKIDTDGFRPINSASSLEQDVPVASSSMYYGTDGSLMGSTTAYVSNTEENWENTGAPYVARSGESLSPVRTDPKATLYDVATGRTTMEQFVAGMTVAQLADIVEGSSIRGTTLSVAGSAGYTTAKYEALGIPGMSLTNGPAGLGITQKIASSPATYEFATAWPVGTLLAQSWDQDLVREVGAAIGAEMREYGATLWLAPGMNIHRDPLNGRNFEYYSEDPLVSGLIGAATTLGVQSVPGVGVTIKHFAANNQEASRQSMNAVISERALRDIYLKGFEIAVKSSQPMAVMSSYNKVNGTYSSLNYDLNTDVLRGEWGFRGLVMTDWNSNHGIATTMYSGNDLAAPGDNPASVINATVAVAPTIDHDGLPAYTKTTSAVGSTSYTWQVGALTLSASGAESFSTVVNSETDLSKASLSKAVTVDYLNSQTVVSVPAYGTVDGAYRAVSSFLSSSNSALSSSAKAAISVADIVRAVPDDSSSPVTSYKVTVKGDYKPTNRTMRLGDLQRSAMRVLNAAMQSAPFAELANEQGVSGIRVSPYTEQFTNLEQYVDVSKGNVTNETGPAPAFTVVTTPAVPASGWYTGPVSVSVSASDGDIVTVAVDGGESQVYTGIPVTVSGDGEHQVLVAVTKDGSKPGLKALTLKTDSTAPTVSVTSAASGGLTLKATDALSGVKSVQYSLDKGKTWKTYTSAVAIPGAPKAVSYRATDKAGNVSAARSVTVQGVLTLSTPSISGTVAVGHKVSAKVTRHTAGASLSYQWKLNGKVVKGATKSFYTLPAFAKGKHLAVTVTEKKSGYATVTKTSAAKTVKAGTLTLSTPSIKGTVITKHTVKASVSRHTSGAKLSYQWKLNGKAVKGATKARYTLPKSAKGKKVTVTVSEKKSGYTTITKTSGSKTVKK
ncbi:glycoside hydrolase family 3 C-terminal domain-containing protein [Luteimicrobium album]|uniref:glycoside hydrolase family 3 C-terminal domain-containing protein n=1 Tax=Luteimicrobium album TaxID=1054550 RepID=UPI0024E0DDCD|nr:glycoside hydrolase family 3 N-terminal domain-containing protein [Luteimicrobium album]